MYIAVRFQKNTSKCLKKDNVIFRLKRDGKNLPTSKSLIFVCILTSRAVSVAYQWVI